MSSGRWVPEARDPGMDSKQRLQLNDRKAERTKSSIMKQGGKCTLVGQDTLGPNRTQACNKAFPSVPQLFLKQGCPGEREGVWGEGRCPQSLGAWAVGRRKTREEGQVHSWAVVHNLSGFKKIME